MRWTTEASGQLVASVEHIRRDDPDAAQRAAQKVIDLIERLPAFPGLGRPGEVKGTRELISPPYVIVYRFNDEIVEILHVWHGSQQWR
ncbi:MAG: type II toxin-antitoxin system RelE/ParE family toxin [Acidobacteria bacterium]|nr:type II toxin-antitoxin system RelE/ParE family toxin [Acidobacteriota bacterium]